MSDPVTAAIIIAGSTLLTTGASVTNSAIQSHKAQTAQENAQAEANRKQQEADTKAEQERLAALAKNQQAQGFDFGVDSALAKRYRDAAQKWGAGTGEMSQKEEEENPFYSRGLF